MNAGGLGILMMGWMCGPAEQWLAAMLMPFLTVVALITVSQSSHMHKVNIEHLQPPARMLKHPLTTLKPDCQRPGMHRACSHGR